MKDANSPFSFIHQRVREGLLLLTIALSVFLLISLLSYHQADPGWSHYVAMHKILNMGGKVGAWLADFFLATTGYLAYLFPFMLSYAAWLYYRNQVVVAENRAVRISLILLRVIGFGLILGAGTGLAGLYIHTQWVDMPFRSGGILGNAVGFGMLSTFNLVGTSLILITLLLIGTTLFTGLSWLQLLEKLGAGFVWVMHVALDKWRDIEWGGLFNRMKTAMVNRFKRKPRLKIEKADKVIQHAQEKPNIASKLAAFAKRKEPQPEAETEESIDRSVSKAMGQAPRYSGSTVLPRVALLDPPVNEKHLTQTREQLAQCSHDVEQRLADFGVQVQVKAVHPGPVITRYELQLAAGTKVSKITGLAKDLARSLSVTSVRVVEIIAGKSVIGIELPNNHREIVSLQEVLASKAYHNARSPLTLALGKDIAGHPVVVDLAKMPHLLVAGTTGSGKSVSLNAMLLSLLYKSTPKQLRLIMIDPKMLELAVYDGIPHLLTPVVTDMKDAAKALRWCVVEMERRYRLMASLGVRNIAGYNEKVVQAKQKGAPLLDPLSSPETAKELDELPQIVVLADEFADMMVVVGKKVETLIARLAQKARAAGVHLILATQRPSVDVITGLIKANIPTRIAFQVSQRVDSRTILDQQGAEQLLGHGDMLYLAPGTGLPVRVHGAYVSDDEVHRVVNYLKQSGEPQYLDEILDESAAEDPSGFTEATQEGGSDEDDPLYDEAVAFITKARRVSVSSVQRRFKIGYNRASRIVEAMESAGVVSKMEGNGSREVLVRPPPE